MVVKGRYIHTAGAPHGDDEPKGSAGLAWAGGGGTARGSKFVTAAGGALAPNGSDAGEKSLDDTTHSVCVTARIYHT